MEDSEKELEEELRSVGEKLVSPPSDAKELLSLLEEAEVLLLKVEQSPSISMIRTLGPVINALNNKDFWRNSDVDVKVAVASCISEITRITAPESPYEDETMKEAFAVIVEAFKSLDDLSSPSYNRRVSILETVANVRSCVVMLDLECDALILQMFGHFFSTISESHTENVFSLMETIMTLVIDESEDIPPELLSFLLVTIKKNNKDTLPIARRLGEKVIKNCLAKLKPSITELIKSTDTPLMDYSEVICSIFQDTPDASLPKAADEFMESPRMGVAASCYEEVDVTRPPETHASNGTFNTANENSLDTDEKGTETAQSGDIQNKEGRKKSETVVVDEKCDLKASLESRNEPCYIASPVATETIPSAHRKRGRPPGSKTSAKKGDSAGFPASSLRVKRVPSTRQATDGAAPSEAISMKKQSEGASNFEEKTLRHSRSKNGKTIQESQAPSDDHSKEEGMHMCDAEKKQKKGAGTKKERVTDNGSSKSQLTHRGRPRKESITSQKTAEGKVSLQEMSSSPNTQTGTDKSQSHSEKTQKTKSSRKRARGAIEGAELIGLSIKVWWPDDKRFYCGAIGSYNPSSKKHEVLYTDGEVEVLNLKNERWEFVDDTSDEIQGSDVLHPSKMPQKKQKANARSAGRKSKDDGLVKSTPTGQLHSEATGSDKRYGTTGKKISHDLRKGIISNKNIKETSEPISKGSSSKRSKYKTRKIANLNDKSLKIKVAQQAKSAIKSSRSEGKTPKARKKAQDGSPNTGTESRMTTRAASQSKVNTPKDNNKGKDVTPSSKSKKVDATAEAHGKGGGTPKSGGKLLANGNSTAGSSKNSRSDCTKDSAEKSKVSLKRKRPTKSLGP